MSKIVEWFKANPWAMWVGLGGGGIGVLYLFVNHANSSQATDAAAQTDSSLTDATSSGDLSGNPALTSMGNPTDFSTDSMGNGTPPTGSFGGLPIGPSGGVPLPPAPQAPPKLPPAPQAPTSTSVSAPDNDSTGPVHVPAPTAPVQKPAPVSAHKATHVGKATHARVPHPSASAHKPKPKPGGRGGMSTGKME